MDSTNNVQQVNTGFLHFFSHSPQDKYMQCVLVTMNKLCFDMFNSLC